MAKAFEGWGKYVGDWEDGKRHGNGTFTTSDGSTFTGQFEDGLEHGSGTYSSTNGTRYEGEWRQGKYHGEGILNMSDGYQIKGEFRKGKLWNGDKSDQEGNKVVIIYQANTYIGETKNNVPHGKGKLSYSNGDRYEGAYVNGERQGKGILESRNGDRYEGAFVNDERQGWGKLKTMNGSSEYIGGFHKGERSGQGVEFTVHGRIGTCKYEGEFEEDEPYGLGTETWSMTGDDFSDTHYVGEFVAGVKHGHGELVRGDGTKFVGEFRDDEEWEGQGYDEQGDPWYSVSKGDEA